MEQIMSTVYLLVNSIQKVNYLNKLLFLIVYERYLYRESL